MDKRKSSILAYMGFLIGVMALGGVVYTTALAEPWVNPICQAATEGMTPEKQASHQAYCAERAAAENRTPPAVKSTSPSFVPDLSNAPKGGPIFGIDDSLPIPPWMIEDYDILNEWLGQDVIVYAGARKGDVKQGVVILATRFVNPIPEPIMTLETSVKDGPLKVTSENGEKLTLTAENNTQYTLDLSTHTLKRN